MTDELKLFVLFIYKTQDQLIFYGKQDIKRKRGEVKERGCLLNFGALHRGSYLLSVSMLPAPSRAVFIEVIRGRYLRKGNGMTLLAC